MNDSLHAMLAPLTTEPAAHPVSATIMSIPLLTGS